MKVDVGNQSPGPLLCPPLPQGPGEKEAPQGSPKEVTVLALKDAGGTDTAPSPRPQHLVAWPKMYPKPLNPTPQDMPLEAPASPLNVFHQAFRPGHAALPELCVLPSGGRGTSGMGKGLGGP